MRKIFDMIDGIPIWQHLQCGGTENSVKLVATDYGKFAEIVGKRLLNKLTEKGGILKEIFSGIEILSVQSIAKMRILSNAKIELGDLILEISYKNGEKFGKKVVIFEIKHGNFKIEQNQLRRYCFMINDPESFFPKADEVKIIFMMFKSINTNKGRASYIMHELGKDLAIKVLNSKERDEENLKLDEGDYE